MNKRYFGSFALQNTIQHVKEQFPECKIIYTEDPKSVSFKFDSESRKKYKLSEGYRTYLFLNGHLILSNGPLDPFKYDALDSLIENTELQYDVDKQKDSVTKIHMALNNCISFFNTTKIIFGNKDGSEYDIKFVLNEVERAYHLDLNSDEVHMQKLDPETELQGVQEYELRKLSPKIIYRILKTTHPGLKTSATEYISGLRDDKNAWKSVEDAYIKPWKKETYESFGISPLDVLADVTESRLVGEFCDNPMRRLILYDGSQYAYREIPLEVIPYSEYQERRNQILQQYKIDIMTVCKATNVIPPKAIETMNVYAGKNPGPMILKSANDAICEIRMERLENPVAGIINKINRAIKLHNHEIGFTAFLRKSGPLDEVKRIDINENGNVTKIDIDMLGLNVSKPYVMTSARKIVIIEDLKRLKLTKLFMTELEKEIKKMKDTPEYKAFLFIREMKKLGIEEGKVLVDEDKNVYKSFPLDNGRVIIYINPYLEEISASNTQLIKEDPAIYKAYEQIMEAYNRIFV
jgi:hypothetical protein